MAGIGFRIQRLLNKESLSSTAQGYLYGVLVAAGPLLILVFTLACLTGLSSDHISKDKLQILRVIIIYVYFIALILTGVLQFTVTRFVADLLYSNKQEKVLSSVYSILIATLCIAGIIGSIFFPLALGKGNTALAYRATALLMTVSGTWMLMNFITATRRYHTISAAFVIGGAISLISAYFLGKSYSLIGYLEGYLIGQFIVFIVLLMVINKSFTLIETFNNEIFSHIKGNTRLFLIGLFLNFSIWIDKILLWSSSYGHKTAEGFWTYDSYDNCTFLALLSVIPSMAYFLIRVETGFYIKYRYYYQTLTNKGSYTDVEEAKEGLTKELFSSFGKLVIIQGIITLFCIIYCNEIMQFFKLSPLQWSLFRVSLMGSMLLIFMQLLLTIMLYFELQKEVLYLSGFYLFTNGIFTYITIKMGYKYLGFGFTVAAFLTLLLGTFIIRKKLKDLLFQTYTNMPLFSNSKV
ncbi:MAG: exopolysaccharide Pel transporter PelG [Lentisphaeraceae bacterium]|nr:exopolysaccharide Pel transporter PelG [Lentisphaeraceae bacterium]